MSVLQPAAARRHAVPISEPRAGTPLIKSTVKTGWMLDTRRVRVPMDEDFPQERRKEFLRLAANQFIKEELKIDGAKYRGAMKVEGPFPHIEMHEPDTQVGDRGGKRLRARSLAKDTQDTGKVDYLLSATFIVPEYINEIPTDLATELFTQPGGRPGLSPLRANEWRGLARGASRRA